MLATSSTITDAMKAQTIQFRRFPAEQARRLAGGPAWGRRARLSLGGSIALSLIALFIVDWQLGLALAVLTLLVFAIVAHYHGKIDRSIARHTLWSYIQATHIARIKLDWSNIPATYASEPQSDHPYEFDLDIT